MRSIARPLVSPHAQASLRPRLSRPASRLFHPSPFLARTTVSNPSNPQSDHEPSEEHRETRPHAPEPKISNQSVPGVDTAKNLSEEQKQEVRKHNEEFDRGPDHGQNPPNDKVDKKFWAGQGTRENPGVSKPKSGTSG